MKLLLFANIRKWIRFGAFQIPATRQRSIIGAGRYTLWR